jgi:hypothetical protein
MKLSPGYGPRAIVATAVFVALAACHPAPRSAPSERPQTTAFTDTAVAEEGYVSPPQVTKADTNAAGIVALTGTAGPGAKVQLQSPEGESQTTTAQKSGTWMLRLSPVDRPRMFALSEIIDGHVVHAEGALIILPRPASAVLLARAGFGSLTIEHAGAGPSLATIDYDPGGFAAFSGTAQPGATVRLSLDGGPVGLAQADAMGRYAVLAANHRLSFGAHVALIETGAGEIRKAFELIQPGPLTSPYQASAEPGGWRVEWAAPGGGVQSVQTTLVLAH